MWSVFAARRRGDGSSESEPARYALKVCRPDAAVIGAAGAARVVEMFTERARVAREVGESAGARWAKVYGVGRVAADEGDGGGGGGGAGAYWGTDLGTRGTCERLVAGKVRLDSRALAMLIGEVVEGLRDLDRALKRGHGDLRASNILLRGEGDWGPETVLLCDPAVLTAEQETQTGVAGSPREKGADLRSLGELIHLLVTHQPWKGEWPIEPTPEWTAMGREGAKWREVAEALLNPNESAIRPGLDDLVGRFAKLRETSGKRRPLMLAGAAALLLAIGVGTAVYVFSEHEQLTQTKWSVQTEDRWKELCNAYRGWYSVLHAGLVRSPSAVLAGASDRKFSTRREAYGALDPELKALMDLPGVGDGFDPWGIARVSKDTELTYLGRTPGKYAQSDQGVDKTEQALSAIDALKKGLTEEWSTPRVLGERGAEFRQRGWTKGAEFVEGVAAGAKPEQSPDVCAAIDQVVATAPLVASVQAAWERILRAGETVKGINDPVLAKFAESAPAMVGAGLQTPGTARREDLLALQRRAGAVAEIGEKLASFVQREWAAIDSESFYAGEKFASLKSGAPSMEAYGEWLAEARRHPSLDPSLDPRRGMDVPGTLAATEERLRGLAKPPVVIEPDAGVRTLIDRVGADWRAVSPEAMVWSRRNQSRVESEAARLKTEMEEIGRAVEGLAERRRSEIAAGAAGVRDRLRATATVAGGSAAANAAWVRWRDGLIASVPEEEFPRLESRAKALESALGELAGKTFPPAMEKVEGGDWRGVIAESTARELELRIGAVLERAGPAAPADPAALIGAAGASAAEYSEWLNKVARMREELGAAEKQLNEGAVGGADDPERTISAWSADPVAQRPEISGAIASLKERAAATAAVRKETSVDALLTRVLTPDPAKPELALAAWRRLGDADVAWPANVTAAGRVGEVKSSLAKVVSAIPSESRRADLNRQISADLSLRWRAMAGKITTPRELEAATGLMKDYSVGEAELDPRLKYNLLVMRLRKAGADPKAPDEGVVEAIRVFEREVGGLSDGVGRSAKAAAVLGAVMPIANGEEPVRPKIDPRTLGPGKVLGAQAGTQEGDRLTFTRGGMTLEFIRIETDGEPVFLSTREMSIGDVIEIFGGQSAWPEARKSTPAFSAAEAAWTGPRGWTFDPKQEITLGNWLRRDENMSAQMPAYAPGIGVPGQIAEIAASAGGEPTREHPIQSISPVTLALAARAIGCRLPTAGEWAAAYKQFAGGATPAGANLRDATFLKQRQHVAAMQSQVVNKTSFQWPDANICLPGQGAAPPSGERATTRAENDGVLWFAKTQSDTGPMHHLVGNVAEFVVVDGPKLEAAAANVRAIEPLLEQGLAVIGGSALSPPELAIDKAMPVDLLMAEEGFADVGARLAFSATGTAPARESFASRLSKAVTDEAFILPAAER